ncbi:MAG: hypothetical protein HQL18_02345, partial [Candidatus Omnitrophica bacterium]|nr:hypothetical protein [Candidatus Omnitrophota bacterium]
MKKNVVAKKVVQEKVVLTSPVERLDVVAFGLTVAAFVLVQLSYLLNGVAFLDLGVLLLIPAFAVFAYGLFKEWLVESKDYCSGLMLLTSAVFFALLFKYRYAVGAIDDNYHTSKIVAVAVQNSYFSIMKYQEGGDARYYLINFVECIWGLLWRFLRWDYIVVLVQILPVFVLWKQLLAFFRNRGIKEVAGFLSVIIVLSMEIIWAQACSTYVDSIAGMVAALVLLKVADLLEFSDQRNLFNIMVAAFLSTLCLITKSSMIFLAIFGLGVSLWYAVKTLTKKQALWTA